MKNPARLRPYQAYVLRFWSEQTQAEGITWRFMLLDTQTGERMGFSSLHALFNYLAYSIEDIPIADDSEQV